MHAVYCVGENRMRTVSGIRALKAVLARSSGSRLSIICARFHENMVVLARSLCGSPHRSGCRVGSKTLDIMYKLVAILPVLTDRHSGW